MTNRDQHPQIKHILHISVTVSLRFLFVPNPSDEIIIKDIFKEKYT